MNKTITRFSVWSVCLFAIMFTVFIIFPNNAKADSFNDFIFFRIDTELNQPNTNGAAALGATVTWRCNGSGYGIVQDGTASESGGAVNADGIVKIASLSAENIAAKAGCDAGESITATASLNGWVSRLWSGTVSAGGANVTFTTYASMDYTIVVNGVYDELNNNLTLNGISASASYDGTVASQSYSNNKRYIAATTSGGYVRAYRDGYTVRTSDPFNDISSIASRSVGFGTDGNDENASGLAFGLKATLNTTSRSGVTESKTRATVTAGNAFGTPCTDNGNGDYYCAVPLADTETSVQGVANGYVTNTATYTDRATKDSAQSTVTFALAENAAGGGSTPTLTPTPTPTPTVSVTPTPTPSVTPTVTPTPTPSAEPVKLYRKVADPKVYVQGADGMLTWVRTLEEFNAAGYKWTDVQEISGPEFAQLKISSSSATSAMLFRKANDPKVYVQSGDGTLTWVRTLEEFNAAGYNWSDVKMISGSEFAQMRVGGNVKVVKEISFLRVRSGPSVADKMVGQVLPGQELKFTETKNGWYKISSGWVSGAYAEEF